MSKCIDRYAEKTEEELRKLIEEAYIDDLLKRCRYDRQWEQGYQDGMIDGYKKRDAEITRCKECKYHEDEEPGMVYCHNILGGWVNDDFFCAYGERRDDE